MCHVNAECSHPSRWLLLKQYECELYVKLLGQHLQVKVHEG